MKRKNQNCSKARYIWLLAAILLSCVLFCAACGSGAQTTVDDPNRIVYVPQYQDIDFGSFNGWMQVTAAQGNHLYILATEYLEAEQKTVNQLLKTDILSGTQEVIPLFDLKENENISALTFHEKGSFAMLTSTYEENGSRYFLYELTPDGRKTAEAEITDIITQNDAMSVNSIAGDGQGNIILTVSNNAGTTTILSVDPAGMLKGTVGFQGYNPSMICASDGSIYLSAWGTEISGAVLRKVDFTSGAIGPEISLAGTSSRGNVTLAGGGTTGVLVNDGAGVYECDTATGECRKLLDYVDSDFFAGTIPVFGTVGEDSYWFLNMIYGDYTQPPTSELVILNQTTAGELPEKKIIAYGTYGVSTEMQQVIIRFNKENPQYRIQIKDYSPSDYNEYEAAMVRYNSDLIGSECPDLIDLVSALDYQLLANKGILADWYPYMEKDDTFNREDYLENILAVYDTEGKLYGVAPSFMIQSLAGSEEMLQGIDRWNISELIAFAEQYPDSLLFDTNANSVLAYFLCSNFDQFVDWDTGECYFESEEFVKILEFANTFPESSETEYSYMDQQELEEKFASKEFLLTREYVSDVASLKRLEFTFRGPVKYIGFPSAERNGIIIHPTASFGLSAKSKVKDGAWEFISFLLSEEAQNNTLYSFPIKKSAVEALLEEAMEEQENTFYVMGHELLPATKEQAAQFRELLERADTLIINDNQLLNIVMEEAESYFAGQKPVEEAADILQSRIQIYVNENR